MAGQRSGTTGCLHCTAPGPAEWLPVGAGQRATKSVEQMWIRAFLGPREGDPIRRPCPGGRLYLWGTRTEVITGGGGAQQHGRPQ